MRIKDLPHPPAAAPKTRGSDGTPSTAREGAKVDGNESVKVRLSPKAQELSSAKAADFDEAKVDRLRHAVESQSLSTDAMAIAKKLTGGEP
jgi:flagellar biosynthesis anti-sigma factor FlgM